MDKTKAIKIIVKILVIVSVIANLVWVGNWYLAKIKQRSFSSGVFWVFNQVKEKEEINYTVKDNEGNITEIITVILKEVWNPEK